jgi:DNA-binding FadR family transcriptional regulator
MSTKITRASFFENRNERLGNDYPRRFVDKRVQLRIVLLLTTAKRRSKMTGLGGGVIRRQRKHDQIIRYLAVGILRGEITNEHPWMASELELCRHLSVSRTVLRESIKVLAAKGLIDVRPKVGIRVLPRQNWNLFDPDLLSWQQERGVDDVFILNLCEVRLIVEPAAAKLAATRATDAEIVALGDAFSEMEISARNQQAYNAADMKFHSAIIDACHNDLLMQMNLTIRAAFRQAQTAGTPDPDGPSKSLRDHGAVLKAIRSRNASEAYLAMEHLVKVGTRGFYKTLHPNRSRHAWKALDL